MSKKKKKKAAISKEKLRKPSESLEKCHSRPLKKISLAPWKQNKEMRGGSRLLHGTAVVIVFLLAVSHSVGAEFGHLAEPLHCSALPFTCDRL